MATKKASKKKAVKVWKNTDNRFVGYIDIMGFKDMVFRLDHKAIYSMMQEISMAIDAFVTTKGKNVLGCKYFLFSDSIVVFSKDGSAAEMSDFMSVMELLNLTLFEMSVPFKGAIAYGNITVDVERSIFFGQPQIDAYLLSEELSLYGVILHHTAEEKLKTVDTRESREYKVPMKNGHATHYMVVPLNGFEFIDGITIENICANYRNMTSGSLRKYIDNTQAFLEEMEKWFKHKR